MNYQIDIQYAQTKPLQFDEQQLKQWIELALRDHQSRAELTLRVVDLDEMQDLNHTYRQQNKPTNVLAFPANLPEDIQLDYPLLGDLIVCPEVLLRESQDYKISEAAHWAHILIHGTLHLLGFDHIELEDEVRMHHEEIKLLAELGYDNPYNNHMKEDDKLEQNG